MKAYLILLIASAPLFSSSQKSSQEEKYKVLIRGSLLGGVQNNTYFKTSAPVFGIEFSMECPLIQAKKSRVRQQLTLMRQNDNNYKSVTVEVNPQYKFIAGSKFELGAGPVAGFIFTRLRDDNKPVFNYGIGSSAMYYFKRVFIGIESRYTMTKKILLDDKYNETMSTETANLNSLRTYFKLGYKLHK